MTQIDFKEIDVSFSQLILVDRSERGHYLMELIAEKQKRDLNNNSSSDEPSDFVAVLQLEDPQGIETLVGILNIFMNNLKMSAGEIDVLLFLSHKVLAQ